MKNKDIKFLRVTYLGGPNIWTYRPVIEAWVDIGELEDYPSNKIPGFYERLKALLPSLENHRCSVGTPGGFLQRVKEGTWPAHILEHVTLELQNLAGMQTGFGKARETGVRGIYKVAFRTREESVGRTALEAGRELLLAAIKDEPFNVAATVASLRELVDSRCLGPSTGCIVDAATERKIPSLRLTDGNLVQLGYGIRQRRIWTAETDRTSAIAESICSDKDLTKTLLESCGIPVPSGYVVNSPEEAWETAEDIGLPVVVKPSDGNHGRGVSIELNSEAEIKEAYGIADAEGSDVIVEQFIPGVEHRLLVVGDALVAAARGECIYIVGDGKSTVVELIDSQLNTDPRRGEAEEFPLETIVLEREPAIRLLLARQGLDGRSVVAAGQQILIQRNGNVAEDCTDLVHPEVAARAVLAAKVVGLDIAGIDLVAQDIAQPLEAQGGAIVEVNAGPGLLMHLKPAAGKPRPVGVSIVDHLFPGDDDGRIPVVGVSGSRGTTLTARLIAWLQHLAGKHVGLACADGLFLDKRQVEKYDCATASAARRILLNRSLEAAVCENGLRVILAEGLGYDRCQVGVVTHLALDPALAEFHVHDLEKHYNVLRTQIDVVLSSGVGVLNAADVEVARMAELCDGEVIFFSTDPEAAPLAGHREAGGRYVVLQGRRVALGIGREETILLNLAYAGFIQRSATPDADIESLLPAIAAAWSLGVPPDLIRAGIETFDPTLPDAGKGRPAR